MNHKWLRVTFFVAFVSVVLLGSALTRLFFSQVSVRAPMGAKGVELRLYVLGGSFLLVLIAYGIQRLVQRQKE